MRILGLFLLSVAVALYGYAQTASGRFVGTIIDLTGAHVAGATVSVTNEKTGEVQTATTNEVGNYVVTQLLPSTYLLKVSHSGFSDGEVKDFVLGVGQDPIEFSLTAATHLSLDLLSGAVGLGPRRRLCLCHALLSCIWPDTSIACGADPGLGRMAADRVAA